MRRIRVIPTLLVDNTSLVKTVRFEKATYVGDPVNAVKIFNEKEVDELVVLDITATVKKQSPNLKLISEIATECFMPFGYGGGITTLEQIREIFTAGAEKVIINTGALENPKLVKEAAQVYGNQSIVVAVDVKKSMFGGYKAYTHSARKNTRKDPVTLAVQMEQMGAGEILLNSIDRDGTYKGFDIELIRKVADSVNIPVIACGGAAKIEDFTEAVNSGGASAVAAGSLFVFHGPHRAVLINYPSQTQLKEKFYSLVT